MAGPGGGPPRKSHTKSRKGCRTCKKRHIRCDETFPQCRNCTKHSCRCDYMDMPAAGEEPMKGSKPPNLLMSPELQQSLDNWRLTGDSPLPELRSRDPVYWTRFSTIDLRLIHHMVTLSTDMQSRGYSNCTPWASKMPSLISAALSHDFVMSALLALSASHLSWQTKNPDTDNLAYHHRGVALKGLHEAIGDFSRENSNAILAASMLMSWQAVEWRPWASLQQGVSTVMNAMRPWAHESELARYLDSQRSITRGRTPSTPTFPTPTPSISNENLRRVEEMSTALHNLKLRLGNTEDLSEHTGWLLEYLRQLQRSFPIPAPEQAFARLQPLRDLIFWLPPLILHPEASDLAALTVLSHLYATALTLESLFPEIGGSYLGEMCLAPIERIHDVLRSRRNSQPQDNGYQVALSLVEVPMQMVSAYKSRQGSSYSSTDAYRSSPLASPYMGGHLPTGSSTDPQPTPFSHSPHQTPPILSTQSVSYFPQPTGPVIRRDSQSSRAQSMSERSMSAGSLLSMSTVYGGQHHHASQQPRSSHETSSRSDYFTQAQAPYHYYGSMNINPRDDPQNPEDKGQGRQY